jgi:hypothetical protein
MRQCQWDSDTDLGIEMRIAPCQPTKDFYAQMKNFASIQSLELKHSITPNLEIYKKLDFYE